MKWSIDARFHLYKQLLTQEDTVVEFIFFQKFKIFLGYIINFKNFMSKSYFD